MSRSSDIDLTFEYPVTVAGVLGTLAGHGWGPVEPLGVSYMLEGDDDWDWTSVEPEQAEEVVARLDAPDLSGTHVGLAIYHPQAATGGNLLFFPDRNTVAFTPAIYRREVPGAREMTDMAWYVEHLVYPLLDGGLLGYELRDMAD
ncbi:hypothetical protein NMG29_18635 [Streptomyces cocklensis]|uniref:Uncharacterized protein n=1 Tax=Actinacidiphila cocklensis TaxID=887465 RepID=A0A9W4DKR6_9ACTN|nr:hypothetical protein [Actinacidiphila cocklensis]MDD1060191.1 hypothetical protein [Actinacidiphila cocklensis]WSX76623.1 hypothetical protein OH826_24010 [Streptomyces sp. NBC_00899]CAG6391780.1 conserved hypothetical protein [Actinacidiphila cocklensis]